MTGLVTWTRRFVWSVNHYRFNGDSTFGETPSSFSLKYRRPPRAEGKTARSGEGENPLCNLRLLSKVRQQRKANRICSSATATERALYVTPARKREIKGL